MTEKAAPLAHLLLTSEKNLQESTTIEIPFTTLIALININSPDVRGPIGKLADNVICKNQKQFGEEHIGVRDNGTVYVKSEMFQLLLVGHRAVKESRRILLQQMEYSLGENEEVLH